VISASGFPPYFAFVISKIPSWARVVDANVEIKIIAKTRMKAIFLIFDFYFLCVQKDDETSFGFKPIYTLFEKLNPTRTFRAIFVCGLEIVKISVKSYNS
jgi:hypothetical protein